MEKVKLPLKITEAIRSLQRRWENKAVLQLKNYEFPTHEEAIVIKEYFKLPDSDGFERLVAALYIGYEVEETPEDKAIKRITKWKSMRCVTDDSSKYELLVEGAQTILNDLNIKIEGIN